MNVKGKITALLEEATEKMDCPQMGELAEYLIANGVIVSPALIGQTVYACCKPFTKRDKPSVCTYEVQGVAVDRDGELCVIDECGELNRIGDEFCFLTEAEAWEWLKANCGEKNAE